MFTSLTIPLSGQGPALRKTPFGQKLRCEAPVASGPDAPSPKEHRTYFSEIGRLGGLGGKGSAARKKSAREAARARWQRQADANGKIVINVEAGRLTFSGTCPELERALQTYHRHRDGHKIRVKKVSFLFDDNTTCSTLLPFLTRAEAALKSANIPYRVTWKRPRPPKPELSSKVLAGLKSREVRALKTLRRLPFGGVMVANVDRLHDLLISLVMAFPGHPVIVVVKEHHQLSGLRFWLRQTLLEPIGELSMYATDNERVVITTPQHLRTRTLSSTGVGLLVFLDPPKKAANSIRRVFEFVGSFRVALTTTMLTNPYALHREALFGPTVQVPIK